MKTIILTCCIAGWPNKKQEGQEVWGTTQAFKTQPELDRVYFMDKLDPHILLGWEPMENLEWFNSLQERIVSPHPNTLPPGGWSTLTLSLPGIAPDQFGYLELSMTTGAIELHTWSD